MNNKQAEEKLEIIKSILGDKVSPALVAQICLEWGDYLGSEGPLIFYWYKQDEEKTDFLLSF